MKLWLMTHLKDSPGSNLILAAARKRGHDVTLVDPLRATLVITPGDGGLEIHLPDGPADLPELVLARTGGSAPPEALHTLRQLEALGVPCVNPSAGLLASRDKLITAQRLAAHGLPMPATALIGRDAPLDPALERVKGPPWIVKLPVSTQGAGVILAESLRSLRSICDAVHSTGQRLLLQEFIAEAGAADTRVLVIEGRTVAAMRRTGQGDEFRSNLHRGGQGRLADASPELTDLAERAARALGLELAGVDLLDSRSGPQVIEVNSSPGLQGVSAATGRDLTAEVLASLERKLMAR